MPSRPCSSYVHIYMFQSPEFQAPPHQCYVYPGVGQGQGSRFFDFLKKSKENQHGGLPDTDWWPSVGPRCRQMQHSAAWQASHGVMHGFALPSGRVGTIHPHTHNPQGGRWDHNSRMRFAEAHDCPTPTPNPQGGWGGTLDIGGGVGGA